MYKDLLVHVKPHEEWSAHIDLAMALGARFGARVTGVAPYENLAIAKLLAKGPGGGGGLIAELQTAADREAAALQERFSKRLQDYGAEGELQVAEGRAHEVLGFAGRFYDLVVVEQTDFKEDDINWSTAEEAAVNSGRPTLIAPRDKPSDGAFRRVLIAWNGGREATRALHAARPIWEQAEEVVLLAGPPREIAASITRAPPGDIESYLRRRAAQVTLADMHVRDADAASRILDVADEAGCGLIVMGAFGRKGLSRLILGGATGRVLREAPVPVFAAH
jgi:nucleotide-binding universal stress UspA family protein